MNSFKPYSPVASELAHFTFLVFLMIPLAYMTSWKAEIVEERL